MHRPGGARYALELRVLVMGVRNIYHTLRWLTDPISAEWLTPSEVDELHSILHEVERLDLHVSRFEDIWRARQVSSPKS